MGRLGLVMALTVGAACVLLTSVAETAGRLPALLLFAAGCAVGLMAAAMAPKPVAPAPSRIRAAVFARRWEFRN
jgi:hypothetical protein